MSINNDHLTNLLGSNKNRLATMQVRMLRGELELSDIQKDTVANAIYSLTSTLKMVLEDSKRWPVGEVENVSF